jgi:hypothetical protein
MNGSRKMMFRRKSDRYEYYFMKKDPDGIWPNPKETKHPIRQDLGAFGNLGSQGWRYIGMVDDMYAFERKSRW